MGNFTNHLVCTVLDSIQSTNTDITSLQTSQLSCEASIKGEVNPTLQRRKVRLSICNFPKITESEQKLGLEPRSPDCESCVCFY